MAARDGSAQTRATALRVMAATRSRELPAAWIAPLVRALAAGDEAARLAVRVAGRAPAPKTAIAELRSALLGTARISTLPFDLRIEALGAAAPGLAALDSDLFELVRSALEPSRPASLRLAAAGVMERARLGRDQLRTLVEVVRTAGPLETPRLIGAFGQESDEAIGLALIAALESSAGRSNVRADVLRPRLAKYPESVQRRAEALLEASTADAARQARQLEALLANLQGGDRRRGMAVFNGPKGTCSACHAIGYLGGKMGPDLTRIGEIRSQRDLLEAVVFPSASFARGFEPVMVTTSSGAVHGGLLRSERADEIVLTQGEGQDVRIRREDIEDIQPASISPMPAGYAEVLTRGELADLLAFLKATRSGPQ
jgi:putative heme-binding domain-containing protein